MFEYDPGDGWEHEITLLGKAHPSLREAMRIPEEQVTFCYAGQGQMTVEACGGTVCWHDLKR